MFALVNWNWSGYPDSAIFSYDFKNPKFFEYSVAMVNSTNASWHPKQLLYSAFHAIYSVSYNETNVDI